MKKEILFHSESFYHFRSWVNLNMQGLTWQGKFEKEFEEFWKIFFIDGLSVEQIIDRFGYAMEIVKIGPLTSWFNWLQEKFLSFTFIYKNPTLEELANASKMNISILANTLRNFFLDKFPHLDDYFSEKFQVGNIASENLDLTFSRITKEVVLPASFSGSSDDEIMPSLEVTLFEEWGQLLEKLKKNVYHSELNFKEIREQASLKEQLKVLYEIILLILLGIGIIYGIKASNYWYENYLADKISVYEPKFSWLDKSKTFKQVGVESSSENPLLPKKDFEKIEDKTNFEEVSIDELFATESEVVLTSWDSLPKDFDVADHEESIYEEKRKAEYRDNRFGNKKVYRVMMKSVDLENSRTNLDLLLEKYNVTQADNVKPGTYVPGGVYYNLFVPREFLKEFLAQVMDVEESTLYESRTRRPNPPGKNKVFIWVKDY